MAATVPVAVPSVASMSFRLVARLVSRRMFPVSCGALQPLSGRLLSTCYWLWKAYPSREVAGRSRYYWAAQRTTVPAVSKQSPCTSRTCLAQSLALPWPPCVARLASRGVRGPRVCPDVLASASEVVGDRMSHVLVQGRHCRPPLLLSECFRFEDSVPRMPV